MTLSSPFIGLDTKRTMSAADEEIVADSLREFNQLQLWRNTFASQWEEASELIYPNFRNTFFYGNFNWPGQKKTDRQIDASGMMALKRFGAICDSLLTPRNSIWHTVVADDDDLMKQRPVALYFEQVTKILFKHRYDEYANFTSQNQSNYQQLGAFGAASGRAMREQQAHRRQVFAQTFDQHRRRPCFTQRDRVNPDKTGTARARCVRVNSKAFCHSLPVARLLHTAAPELASQKRLCQPHHEGVQQARHAGETTIDSALEPVTVTDSETASQACQTDSTLGVGCANTLRWRAGFIGPVRQALSKL